MNRAMKRNCAQCHKVIASLLHKMQRAYPRREEERASNYKHDYRLGVGYTPDLGMKMNDEILKFAFPDHFPVDGCDSSDEEDEEDTILEEINELLAESLGLLKRNKSSSTRLLKVDVG